MLDMFSFLDNDDGRRDSAPDGRRDSAPMAQITECLDEGKIINTIEFSSNLIFLKI